MSADDITADVLDTLDPRYRRLGRLLVGMGVMLLIGAAVLAYTTTKAIHAAHRAERLTVELAQLVRGQQAQRQRNALEACRRTNDDRRNLRLFVRDVAPPLLPRARTRFGPISRDCAAYAERRVTIRTEGRP